MKLKTGNQKRKLKKKKKSWLFEKAMKVSKAN